MIPGVQSNISAKINIVVAGASGYIGSALMPRLSEKFPNATIYALSRNKKEPNHPQIIWKACDLFSLKSLEKALPAQVDLAIYLVHSMGPTAALDQGSFAEYDLILSDNFARAVKSRSLRQLIYLGGIIPENKKLSLHLQSRLEVEDTFKERLLPLTVFRAGLIMGDSGSSFQILLKLIKRLPVLVCPTWTKTLTTPIGLDMVLSIIVQSALNERDIGKTYDLAGCRPITYRAMLEKTAKHLGLTRLFIGVPFFSPTLSRLWVAVVTNSPRELVYPLVESLRHSMVASEKKQYEDSWQSIDYSDLLPKLSLKETSSGGFVPFRAQRKTVRSVQRLPRPTGKDAKYVREEYFKWLYHFLRPLINVRFDEGHLYLSFLGRQWPLLTLELSKERSSNDRQLLYITGGILASNSNKGRLEFRSILGGQYILAAIHDYKPSIPWFIYRYTQAVAHSFVMRAFSKHLRNLN